MPLKLTFEIKTKRTYPQLRSHLAKIKAHSTSVEFGMGDGGHTAFIFNVAKLEDITAIAAHMQQLGEGTLVISGQLNLVEVAPKRPRPRVGRSVQSLGLPATLVAFLAKSGITTIAALTALSYTELRKIDYIGGGKANTIVKALKKNGLHLRPD